jgi:hypothetical protein
LEAVFSIRFHRQRQRTHIPSILVHIGGVAWRFQTTAVPGGLDNPANDCSP